MDIKKVTHNGFFELATLAVLIISLLLFSNSSNEAYTIAALPLLGLSFIMTLMLPKRDLRLWLMIGWGILLIIVIVFAILYGIMIVNAMNS